MLQMNVYKLHEEVTTGQYLNHENDPTEMLAQLKKVRKLDTVRFYVRFMH